ncbi:MAG: iron ABC transporter substrate-binding protein [Dehalococcoidia bacterium]
MRKWIFSVIGLMVVLSIGLTACTREQTLTIYSGRGETLVGPIIEQFQEATGIKVAVKYGSSSAMALTILEEGENTPADLYYGSDPGSLGALSHLFTQLPDSILNQVAEPVRSPEGKWVGLSGRARVIVYNTERVRPEDLPDSIFDFTDPQWKGRIGWPPTNGSFQAMVTAMRLLWGEQKTRQWLEGIQANDPKVYPKNTPIVAAAGAGEIDVGFVNHYYLYRFLQEEGESFPARNYYLKGGDPGVTMLVAGAGILTTSKNKDVAERFLEFMLSPVAQQYFASQTFEYPLVEGVRTHRELVPLDQLELPNLDLSNLSDIEGTLDLLRETGVLP